MSPGRVVPYSALEGIPNGLQSLKAARCRMNEYSLSTTLSAGNLNVNANAPLAIFWSTSFAASGGVALHLLA